MFAKADDSFNEYYDYEITTDSEPMVIDEKHLPGKYFIDTDCGIDDAECIFTMLGHLDVVGISTVAGNCSEEQSAINSSKVLELCNKEVPIYKGCKSAILEKHIDLGPVHV